MRTKHVVYLCAAAMLAACLVGAGLANGPTSGESKSPFGGKIGASCIVHLRRDALGAASPSPIPPKTSNLNGAEISMAGTLSDAAGEWIVLSQDKWEYVIPTHAILSVRFEKVAPKN